MHSNAPGLKETGYKIIKGKTTAAHEIDPAIICSFNSNDEDAFEIIYNKLFPVVFYFAKRFAATEEAEDITADAFYRIWKMEKKFKRLYSIKVFLQVSVRNAAINSLEHKKVVQRTNTFLENTTEQSSEPFDDNEQIKEKLLEHVLTAIQNLPGRRKKVFELSYISGMKDPEIANKLHISISSVYNHKSGALKQLRLLLPKLFLLFLIIH